MTTKYIEIDRAIETALLLLEEGEDEQTLAYNAALVAFIKNMENVPAADVKPRWIPVTERLPEEGEIVLATHLGGLNPERQVIEHIYQNGEFTCGWDMDTDFHSPTFGQRYMGKVIAWMPLPTPYKGGEEE